MFCKSFLDLTCPLVCNAGECEISFLNSENPWCALQASVRSCSSILKTPWCALQASARSVVRSLSELVATTSVRRTASSRYVHCTACLVLFLFGSGTSKVDFGVLIPSNCDAEPSTAQLRLLKLLGPCFSAKCPCSSEIIGVLSLALRRLQHFYLPP